MVETSAPNEKPQATENRQEKLEKPIASPRKKITKRETPVRVQPSKVAGPARAKSSDQASKTVSSVTQGLRAQAQTVSEVARDHPGTTTSVLGVVGVLGFFLGLLVGRALTDNERHRWY
ncbi:hypothetical protein N8E89_25215 (plasmid) [Phyllobacterium sp. A18/5-2]|uniref:hypothetical protein n=1 Tax=Phyllobacterium sp. A18/5-2 TaxID=2978392 RepID=UPI0021C7D3A4|nr:hypothetical protein [Phyllobacterium sp. A18/5-2]UXN66429.1 hypothetical protein N8E89_25215 [Phyllobacterium sp. A18/5-2]